MFSSVSKIFVTTRRDATRERVTRIATFAGESSKTSPEDSATHGVVC